MVLVPQLDPALRRARPRTLLTRLMAPLRRGHDLIRLLDSGEA
jgi:hypothetical protein